MDTTTIEWHGHTLTVPTSLDDCPREIVKAFRNNEADTIVETILGDQLAAIEADESLTVGQMRDLYNEVGIAMGFRSSGE